MPVEKAVLADAHRYIPISINLTEASLHLALLNVVHALCNSIWCLFEGDGACFVPLLFPVVTLGAVPRANRLTPLY